MKKAELKVEDSGIEEEILDIMSQEDILTAISDEKQKNVLMKALGPEVYVEGQYLSQTLRVDDVLILCTDGLYNAVSTEDAIAICESVLQGTLTLEEAVDSFLNKALEQGARDNLTLILYLHGKMEI